MNFTEGTRRLALLVRVLGVVAGGSGSYLELKNALQQKALHDKFERLAGSDDVIKERKCRLLGYASGCSQIQLPANATLVDPNGDIEAIAEPVKNPPGWEDVPKDDFADIAEPIHPSRHGHAFLAELNWNKMSRADQDKFLNSLTLKQQEIFAADMGWKSKPQTPNDPYANLPDTSIPTKVKPEYLTPLPSELDRKEIKTVNWAEGKDYSVESIVTEDGNTLHATDMPSRSIYFWAIIFPIAGFAIPWGLIRSVQWVAAGFFTAGGSR